MHGEEAKPKLKKKKNMGKMLEETIILEKKAVERNYASIKITIVKVRQSLL